MLLPGTLAYVAKAFSGNPDVDLVYGHRIFVDRDGSEIGRAVLPRHDQALKWADYIPQETMFWRSRLWQGVAAVKASASRLTGTLFCVSRRVGFQISTFAPFSDIAHP